MCNGVLRTSFNTVAAENTASVIDVIDLSVTLIHANSFFGGSRIVFSNDVYTFRRTGSRTQETGNAFLSSQFIDMQQMLPAITRLHSDRLFRILDRPLSLGNIRQGDAHALNNGLGRFNDICD